MVGGVRKIEFEARVDLCMLTRDWHKTLDVVVRMAFEANLIEKIRLCFRQSRGGNSAHPKLRSTNCRRCGSVAVDAMGVVAVNAFDVVWHEARSVLSRIVDSCEILNRVPELFHQF